MQTHVPTVRQFMTPNPVIVDGGLSIADAFTRMFQIHARHLPVYSRGHLVGILSDRDIAHLSAVQGVDPNRCTAEQACSPNPYVCSPDASLADVAQVLVEHRFGAALVMDSGKLVGMFTVTDAMQALVGVLRRDEAQAADPDHTWTVSTSGPEQPGVDLDTRHGHTGPDLDKSHDRRGRPDLDQSREDRGPDLDQGRDAGDQPDLTGDTGARNLIHTPDPRRDGLQTVEDRRADIHQPVLQRSGAMHGVSGDVRSDAGRRSDIRRAAATVHRP
jgi:acetoin utilization protein AcuB